jgi:hypothetical protein
MTTVGAEHRRRAVGETEMLIADLGTDFALIVPMLILVAGIIGLVAWFAYGSRGGRGARVAAWLGLVTLTLWCGSALAFPLVYIVLFNLGPQAAAATAAIVTVFMVAMPFGWALVVRHHDHGAMESQPR